MDIFAEIDSFVDSLDKETPKIESSKQLRLKLEELEAIFEELAKRSNSLHQSRKGDIKDLEVS